MHRGEVPPDDRRCTATVKSTGQRCRRLAKPGTTVCVKHGANAPHIKRKAAERVEVARVAAEVARIEGTVGQLLDARMRALDPAQALLDAVSRSGAWVAILTELAAELPVREEVQDAWDRGLQRLMEESAEFLDSPQGKRPKLNLAGGAALYGPDHHGEGAPHVLVVLLGQWEDRHAKVSKMAIDAGIAERQVRLAEGQGRLIVDVLRGALRDVGIPETPELAAAIGRRLRTMSAPIDARGVEVARG